MDLRKVKKLIELVEESGIAELEVTSGDESVRIAMGGVTPVVTTSAGPAAVVAPAEPALEIADASARKVLAPMSGTFYRAPSPDASPFIEVGQQVSAGTVICIIESMKMMHEIRAEQDGQVARIDVANGTPIKTGDVLVTLS